MKSNRNWRARRLAEFLKDWPLPRQLRVYIQYTRPGNEAGPLLAPDKRTPRTNNEDALSWNLQHVQYAALLPAYSAKAISGLESVVDAQHVLPLGLRSQIRK